ncbi:hypothetical protein EHO57_13835 [Leptospira langatensis]|uniref:Uncharacterized protein n=1 Tax=Leptospira langatensis TaxID=2484983 RepID=A0A5R2ASX0_9LEPT|nr:hypothetical protein [Leptospira langatensis]TGJ99837.1 hypothetical protein EHO57_13835 [Leptospira langatensis]
MNDSVVFQQISQLAKSDISKGIEPAVATQNAKETMTKVIALKDKLSTNYPSVNDQLITQQLSELVLTGIMLGKERDKALAEAEEIATSLLSSTLALTGSEKTPSASGKASKA